MIRIGIPVRLINKRYVVNSNYVKALTNAKAEVVIILPESDLSRIIEGLDGILIPGGSDIDPSLYHEENTNSIDIDPEIDALDLSVIKVALTHHCEIFGICRGLQIINVALGGSLIQDMPTYLTSQIDHNFSENHNAPIHGHLIQVTPDSKLAQCFPHGIEVNSYHHQAIKKLADGLSVSAFSEDGMIEAFEGERLFAVQWHPERMIENPLFQQLFDDFVARCDYKQRSIIA